MIKYIALLIITGLLQSCASKPRISDEEKKLYSKIRERSSVLYTKKKDEKNYYFHNEKTGNREEVDFTDFCEYKVGAPNSVNNNCAYNVEKKQVYLLGAEADQGIRHTIDNVDFDLSKKEKIYLVYNHGGYLVRTVENGQRYYQHINGQFKKGLKIKENDVFFLSNEGDIFPFVYLEANLFYPILFDSKEIEVLPRPNSSLVGVNITPSGDDIYQVIMRAPDGEMTITSNYFYPHSEESKYRYRKVIIGMDYNNFSVDELHNYFNDKVNRGGYKIVKKDIELAPLHYGLIKADLLYNTISKKYYFSKRNFKDGYVWYNFNETIAVKIKNRGVGAVLVAFENPEQAIRYAKESIVFHQITSEQQRKMEIAEKKRAEWLRINGPRIAAERRRRAEALENRRRKAAREKANRFRFSDIDFTQGIDLEAVKAKTKCIQKRAASKRAATYGKQNWYYEGGCN